MREWLWDVLGTCPIRTPLNHHLCLTHLKKTVPCPLALLFLNFHSVPLCVSTRLLRCVGGIGQCINHPITPLTLEDCLIRQRIRVCWKNEAYRCSQTLPQLSWAGCLATDRKRRWWGDKCKTRCLFIHTHTALRSCGKGIPLSLRHRNSSAQCQRSGGQMFLDPRYITSGWQVFITLYKVSTYSATAKQPKLKYIPFEIKLIFPGFQTIKRLSRTDKYCLITV